MPRRIASRGVRMRTGCAVQADFAAEQPVDAEHGARERGAAGADQPGQAEDFAVPHREAHGCGRETRVVTTPPMSQPPSRGVVLRRDVERLQVAADHQPDHRRRG